MGQSAGGARTIPSSTPCATCSESRARDLRNADLPGRTRRPESRGGWEGRLRWERNGQRIRLTRRAAVAKRSARRSDPGERRRGLDPRSPTWTVGALPVEPPARADRHPRAERTRMRWLEAATPTLRARRCPSGRRERVLHARRPSLPRARLRRRRRPHPVAARFRIVRGSDGGAMRRLAPGLVPNLVPDSADLTRGSPLKPRLDPLFLGKNERLGANHNPRVGGSSPSSGMRESPAKRGAFVVDAPH
jgi:hypothetical protein